MSSLKIQKLNQSLLLSLPNELLLSCIARVSRLYHPNLSLVSKRFRSLIASPQLYKARSFSGHAESCLYVCLNFNAVSHWFTLYRKPLDQELTNDDTESSLYVLTKVPLPSSFPVLSQSLVASDSYIYKIASSTVSILDCRSRTWLEAPGFQEILPNFQANVVDQKIYVGGTHYDALPGKNLVKVFDTKTQIWDDVPIPRNELQGNDFSRSTLLGSACINGKFHMKAGREVVAYDSKEDKWDFVEPTIGAFIHLESCCEIDNVLYSFFRGVFRWYDSEVSTWRELKGLEDGLLKFPLDADNVRFGNYGGKIAVLWTKYLSSNEKMIWCAEIALERRDNCEMWGRVEWFDAVLKVPESGYLVKALAVTL